MQEKELKKPKIYPINQLPQFVQMAVSDMWESKGIKPGDDVDVLFTYFEGIYTARKISTDIFIHESVHFIRQGAGENENQAKDWWLRYCSDDAFRYQEEVLAYREQYQYILRNTNRPVAFNHAKRLATDLSGPMYGKICSFQTALNDIIKK